MIILFFTLFSFCAQALMMPPGFVLRQFGHTRDKLSTAKIEQKVSYGEVAFTETIMFKSHNKYRIVVSNNNGSVTFVRNGDKCVTVMSQKKIDVPCQPAKDLFYYNLLLMNSEPIIAYLKLLKIEPREGVVTVKREDSIEAGTYSKPEGIQLLSYNNTPIYLIGVSDSTYKSAVSAVSSKPDLNAALVEEIKYKEPQLWMDKNNSWPIRVYGKTNGDDFDLTLGSYTTDGNDVSFPKSISLSLKGKNVVSYSVSTFETGVELVDDTFSTDSFKKLPLIKLEDVTDSKGKMVEYLRDYR